MRKAAALFITCLLAAQLLMPVFAGAGSAEQMNTVKSLFKIPAEAQLERDTGAWYKWNIEKGEEGGWGEAYFDTASNGELIQYSEAYDAPRLTVAMTPVESRKYLEGVIAKLWPAKKLKVRFDGEPHKSSIDEEILYIFWFERVEVGVPVRSNGIYFEFNASTGRVIRAEMDWYKGELPDRNGIITVQEARKLITDNMRLQLKWVKIPSDKGDLKFDLRPIFSIIGDYNVNAITSELMIDDFDPQVPYNFDANDKPKSSPLFNPEILISEQEAAAVAKSEALIPPQYKLEKSIPRWSWGEQGRTRDFIFTFIDEKGEYKKYVTVDMVAGRVIFINTFSPYGAEEPDNGEGSARYNFPLGKEKGEAYFKSLASDVFSETRLFELDFERYVPAIKYPHYKYIRYIYGIPYMENKVAVEIDENTGELSRYELTWERNLNVPQLTGILDIDKIRDLLARDFEMELVYRVEQEYIEESFEPIDTVSLRYEPKEESMALSYDGVTGEKTDPDRMPAGVAGHWAEADFRFLAGRGIVDAGTAIKPNKPISRADFVKMLVLGTYLISKTVTAATFSDVGLSNPYNGYVEQAYDRGIVKGAAGNFHPERPVTRQEAAVMMVKALKSEGRIDTEIKIKENSFKDKKLIAPWAAPDVNLAAQLGCIKGANGYFKPAGYITWAEAASLISNYIIADTGTDSDF
jgi:hypothetical protein